MVDLVSHGFETAEKYRMPAMILADGMLGQMMEPVCVDESKKPNMIEKPWAVNGHEGKRPHNIVNSLYLKAEDLERLNKERFARYEIVKQNEQMVEEYMMDDAELVVVAYGASSRVAKSAVKTARAQGIKVGCIRPITLWPFPTDAVKKACAAAKKFLVVEMSLGQMVDDVRLAVNGKCPVEFYGRTGGVIPTPAEILKEIQKQVGGNL